MLTLSNGNKVTVKNGLDTTITVRDDTGTQDFIIGTAGNDSLSGYRIWGLAGNDRLSGGNGDDYLVGAYGNDSLNGGVGNDHLDGNTGNDYLDGGTDNDTLIGGSGDNTMTGGGGNDVFCCGSNTGIVSNDFITDYAEGEVVEFMYNLTYASAESAIREGNVSVTRINLSDGSTIDFIGNDKAITCKQGDQFYTLKWNGSSYDWAVATGSGSSGMMASSAPIVGSPSAQLSSLVSTTQTGTPGGLTNTGLASPEATGSSLIAAGGTSNPLTNKKTA